MRRQFFLPIAWQGDGRRRPARDGDETTYMHMLYDGHLLTIGYDADDHGSFAYFDGVMLQIFDVTDPQNPTLAHKHIIGTRGSSSEALTNHLAFTWYPRSHCSRSR